MKTKFPTFGFRFSDTGAWLKTAAFTLLLGAVGRVTAAPYPGCATPANGDFSLETLVTQSAGNLAEPVKMSFDMTPQGNVNIYFVELAGKVREYDASTKTVTTLGTLNVHKQDEYGLMGIVLDPNFETNHFMYLWYMPNQSAIVMRLSRFTLNGTTLDMSSEKIMITVPCETGWHGGGGMAFDSSGNLWLGIGDTRSGEVAAPNTNDLRGKTIRIHPEADGSYTVPAGNLFPAGTAKTLPEIYIMGNREPYTLDIDPKTQWVVWGGVGPDGNNARGPTEEFNLATKPENEGFPYFAGYNLLLTFGDGIHTTPSDENPASPYNTCSCNTGITNLPPATPAVYAYDEACAMTGPIYRYNYIPNSPVKMPPQFDGLWFVTDFQNSPVGGYGAIDTMSVDATGKPGPIGRVLPNISLTSPTDFKVGPDGAFYVMNYAGDYSTVPATAIVRITYSGSCRPPVTPVAILPGSNLGNDAIKIHGYTVSLNLRMAAEMKLWDLDGVQIFAAQVPKQGSYNLKAAAQGRPGLYLMTLRNSQFSAAKKIFLGNN